MSPRRIEAADKLLQDYRDAAVADCFAPTRETRAWLAQARKAVMDILTGEAKLHVPAPRLEDFNPEREAA